MVFRGGGPSIKDPTIGVNGDPGDVSERGRETLEGVEAMDRFLGGAASFLVVLLMLQGSCFLWRWSGSMGMGAGGGLASVVIGDVLSDVPVDRPGGTLKALFADGESCRLLVFFRSDCPACGRAAPVWSGVRAMDL